MANSTKEYSTPLKDELKLNVNTFGSDIIYHYDKKNKRLLLDIPMGERRKISSTGSSMILATGRLNLDEEKGDIQLNLNAYDKRFTEEEIPKLNKFLQVKKEEAEFKKQLKDLRS